MVLCVAAVLGLLSGGQAAPLTCQKLVQPLEKINLETIQGKWVLIGSSMFKPEDVSSFWSEVNITSPNTIGLTHTMKGKDNEGKCASIRFNFALENNTLNLNVSGFLMSKVFLKTDCPDCLLIQATMGYGEEEVKGVLFYNRRREVSPEELQTFKKQMECFNISPPYILSSQNEPCPQPAPEDVMDFVQFVEAMKALAEAMSQIIEGLAAMAEGIKSAFTGMFG